MLEFRRSIYSPRFIVVILSFFRLSTHRILATRMYASAHALKREKLQKMSLAMSMSSITARCVLSFLISQKTLVTASRAYVLECRICLLTSNSLQTNLLLDWHRCRCFAFSIPTSCFAFFHPCHIPANIWKFLQQFKAFFIFHGNQLIFSGSSENLFCLKLCFFVCVLIARSS